MIQPEDERKSFLVVDYCNADSNEDCVVDELRGQKLAIVPVYIEKVGHPKY